MKITCNEYRNRTVCGFIFFFALITLGLVVRRYSGFGPLEVGMIVLFAYFAVVIGYFWYFSPKMSYRFSGTTLELLRRERVVQQWDLESVGVQVLKNGILINRRPLPELPPYGKALKIISRRLIRLAEKGHARIQPEPVLGWREKLQFLVSAGLWLCLGVVTFVPLMLGVFVGSVLFRNAYYPEVLWSVESIGLTCLLITMAIYAPLVCTTYKIRKVFGMPVYTFVGRFLGVKENDIPPLNTRST